MMSGPCFVSSAVAQTSRPGLMLQPVVGTPESIGAAPISADLSAPSLFQSGNVALSGSVLLACAMAFRSSRQPRSYVRSKRGSQCRKTTRLMASETVSIEGSKDYVLEGSSNITKALQSIATPGEDTSLTAYMRRPKSEFGFLPLPGGVKFLMAGQEISPFSNTKEYKYNLTLPKMAFPGVFEVEASSDAFVAKTPDSITVEGNSFNVSSGVFGNADPEAMSKMVNKFHTKTVFTWVETPEKTELNVAGACSVNIATPDMMQFAGSAPDAAWNTIGQGIMDTTLSAMLDTFANAFTSDYENWAKNKAYRDECTEKGAKLAADLN